MLSLLPLLLVFILCSVYSSAFNLAVLERTAVCGLFSTTITKDTLSWNCSSNGVALTDPCSWNYITCDNTKSHITDIRISKQINARFPSFEKFTQLYTLDLSYNSLAGTLASSYFPTSLNYISLYANKVSGTIPSFAQHTSLYLLNLGSNKLNGTISSSSFPTSLGIFWLSSNPFTSGPIPSFANFSIMYWIDLGSCNLQGTINAQHFHPIVSTLNLYSNYLTGTIPSLTHLTSLHDVNLASNGLGGSIDSSHFPLSIRHITVNSNSFLGMLPSFHNFTSLQGIDISFNLLWGQLQSSYFPASLTTLSLHHNHFTGAIPALTHCTGLTTLQLSNCAFQSIGEYALPNTVTVVEAANNQLTGPLPASWDTSSLQTLDVSRNLLTGSITMKSFTNIKTLLLRNNRLTGELPTSFGTQATFLDLSFNLFNGSILHRSFGGTTTLTQLNLANNAFNGSIPTGWNTYTKLTLLNLSCNAFSGSLTTVHIPSSLTSFYASHNQLTGSLPVLNTAALTFYDLSYNQFGGALTSSMFSTSIKFVYLEHNQLIGTLPKFNAPKLIVLDISFNQLHGVLTTNLCTTLLTKFLVTGNTFTCYPTCLAPITEDFIEHIPHCYDELDHVLCDLASSWSMPSIVKNMIESTAPLEFKFTQALTFEFRTYNAKYYQLYFNPETQIKCAVRICLFPVCTNENYLLWQTGNADSTWWGVGNRAPFTINSPFFYFQYDQSCFTDPSYSERGAIGFVIPYVVTGNGWDCTEENITGTHMTIWQANNYCEWTGIKCSSIHRTGNIAELSVKAFGIVGTAPLTRILTVMPYLTSLVLSHNAFHGNLTLFDTNTSQRHNYLKTFDVSFNFFTGSLPATMIHLTSLITFSAKVNYFTGTLPLFLAAFNNKRIFKKGVSLDLSYNTFTGQIPSPLCRVTMTQLTINVENNPDIACYSNASHCNLLLDSKVGYCAPTAMPTTFPTQAPIGQTIITTTSASSAISTVQLIVIVCVIVFGLICLAILAYYWILHHNASISAEDFETKYKALPLHKAVVTGNEITLDMVMKEKDTIRQLVDEDKSILSLILIKRPVYPITSEVFLFIVKELLLVKGQIIENTDFFCTEWSHLIQSDDPIVIAAINAVLMDHTEYVSLLAYGHSASGRFFVDIASLKVSTLLMQYVYLHKQFALHDSYEYRSKTCEVILAEYHALSEEECDRFHVMNVLKEQQSMVETSSNKEHNNNNNKPLHLSRSNTALNNKTFVALKFMKHKDLFENELAIIQKLSLGGGSDHHLPSTTNHAKTKKASSNHEYIITLLHAYDGDTTTTTAEDTIRFREDAIRKKYVDYPYCLVMEAAKANLEMFLMYSDTFCNDWETIQQILSQVLQGIQYLHHHGVVHGDIKPSNVVLTYDGKYKLIDFDAATTIGAPLGKKVSTAYCPPEMLVVEQSTGKIIPRLQLPTQSTGTTTTTSIEYELLPADPSYDYWACGMVLYYLSYGAFPFVTNNNDNLTSDSDALLLMEWKAEVKEEKIRNVLDKIIISIDDWDDFEEQNHSPTATATGSTVTATAASGTVTGSAIADNVSVVPIKTFAQILPSRVHNLLSLILQKAPNKRPTIPQILSHPFFTNQQQPRMVGHEATYDVFLSYRVASDFKHAAHLYWLLKEQYGLRVWFDKVSLEAGKNWEKGFCEGLIKSATFVCLISKEGMFHPEKSTQNVSRLTATAACDNCVLEWRLAMEMQERGMVKGIFPLFIGEELTPTPPVTSSLNTFSLTKNTGKAYAISSAEHHTTTEMEFAHCENLEDTAMYSNFFDGWTQSHSQQSQSSSGPKSIPGTVIVKSIEKKVSELLDSFGYGASYFSSTNTTHVSVKNIWDRMVSNQGGFVEGEYRLACDRIGKSIHEMVKTLQE